ncbi:MAG: NAD synthetase [Euryarchaeota archaeon]|nr:NAD synthetase [Euryarchaeota archaeon]
MNWTLGNKEITEPPKGYAGFVYLITNSETGMKYIGRKYFWSVRKLKGKTRRQRSESNWQDYYGSSKVLLEDLEKIGKEAFIRQMLSIHKTNGDVNYEEVKQQFIHDVLETEGWYNENINGKWHRKPEHIMEARIYG